MLSEACLQALRYYVGEGAARPELPDDPKAYSTLNALFFAGLDTERARAAEGRPLNAALLREPEALLALCQDLLEALRPGGEKAPARRVWRVDRVADVEAMRLAGRTVSFTSTSTAGLLDAYTDKRGLALLEIDLPAGAPQADMAALLPRYVKPEEAEILLPPWLPLAFSPRPLTEREQAIRDCDGNPPAAAYTMRAGDSLRLPENAAATGLPRGEEIAARVY
ncbi:MAG: hypothetical protein IJS53_02305, partial [Clostridia bacterium]|nr:hypothetical protein [Clostridia bacterium]